MQSFIKLFFYFTTTVFCVTDLTSAGPTTRYKRNTVADALGFREILDLHDLPLGIRVDIKEFIGSVEKQLQVPTTDTSVIVQNLSDFVVQLRESVGNETDSIDGVQEALDNLMNFVSQNMKKIEKTLNVLMKGTSEYLNQSLANQTAALRNTLNRLIKYLNDQDLDGQVNTLVKDLNEALSTGQLDKLLAKITSNTNGQLKSVRDIVEELSQMTQGNLQRTISGLSNYLNTSLMDLDLDEILNLNLL